MKNPLDSIESSNMNDMTTNMKQVGKSMFININGNDDEPNNMVAQPQNNLKLTHRSKRESQKRLGIFLFELLIFLKRRHHS